MRLAAYINTNKFNAHKTEAGFDSKLEERRYYQLRNDPHVMDIAVHPVFEIFAPFKKCIDCRKVFERGTVTKCPECGKKLMSVRGISYIADFRVEYDDGRIEIEDVKGVETEAFKLKRKLFEAAYPDLTLVIVRESDMKKVRQERRAMRQGVRK